MEGETRVDVLWTGFDAGEEGDRKKQLNFFYTVPKVYFGQMFLYMYTAAAGYVKRYVMCKLPLIYMPCQPLIYSIIMQISMARLYVQPS